MKETNKSSQWLNRATAIIAISLIMFALPDLNGFSEIRTCRKANKDYPFKYGVEYFNYRNKQWELDAVYFDADDNRTIDSYLSIGLDGVITLEQFEYKDEIHYDPESEKLPKMFLPSQDLEPDITRLETEFNKERRSLLIRHLNENLNKK